MKNLEYDKALMLLVMLRVQHLNKRVCDVLPCDYACTFAETEFYDDGDMISLELEEIEKFAKEINLDVKYLLGEKYYDFLSLDHVKTMPENIIFNVNSVLSLGRVRSIPANVVFDIRGSLWLESVEIIHSSVQFVKFLRLVLPFDKKVKIIW